MSVIEKLSTEFKVSCDKPMSKDLMIALKAVKKNVLDSFLVVKNYKKTKPDASDEERYTDLVNAVIENVKIDSVLDKYLLNSSDFYLSFTMFLQSEVVFSVIQDEFKKGVYPKMIDKINRMFNPKDEDDQPISIFDVLVHVKQYSTTFEPLLTDFSTNGFLYRKLYLTNEHQSILCEKDFVFNFCKKGYDYFGISRDLDEGLIVYIASKTEIKEFKDDSTNIDTFLKEVRTGLYNLISIDNHISLETLKRIYASKKNSFDEFEKILELLEGRKQVKYYKTIYKTPSDYSHISEDNLVNILKGVAKSMEDFTKNIFSLMQLDGKVGNVILNGYWLTIGDIENCLPEFDRDGYYWEFITKEQFLEGMKLQGNIDTIIIH